MVTTVTTVVSTIVSSSAATGLLAALSGAAIAVLLVSLVAKELASTAPGRPYTFSRNLDIMILPLVLVFFLVVAMKVYEIIY